MKKKKRRGKCVSRDAPMFLFSVWPSFLVFREPKWGLTPSRGPLAMIQGGGSGPSKGKADFDLIREVPPASVTFTTSQRREGANTRTRTHAPLLPHITAGLIPCHRLRHRAVHPAKPSANCGIRPASGHAPVHPLSTAPRCTTRTTP